MGRLSYDVSITYGLKQRKKQINNCKFSSSYPVYGLLVFYDFYIIITRTYTI